MSDVVPTFGRCEECESGGDEGGDLIEAARSCRAEERSTKERTSGRTFGAPSSAPPVRFFNPAVTSLALGRLLVEGRRLPGSDPAEAHGLRVVKI